MAQRAQRSAAMRQVVLLFGRQLRQGSTTRHVRCEDRVVSKSLITEARVATAYGTQQLAGPLRRAIAARAADLIARAHRP